MRPRRWTQGTRRWPWVALLAGVLLAAAGCAGTEPTAQAPADEPAAAETTAPTPTPTPGPTVEPTPEPTPAPTLRLVATVAPLAELAQQVGGTHAVVDPLIPPGADSHTYEPRPRDVALFADADAFLGIGLDLNPAAVRLAEENLPEGSPLVLLGEAYLEPDRLVRDHDHGHDHGTDHGHDHGTEGDDDSDDGPGPNPHVWMSVRLAMELVDGITETLQELDPDRADAYADQARTYLLELRALDEAIAEAVASIPDEHRTFVTYHDAWGYFAFDYDLDSVTAVQPTDFSEPSAADVRAIIDLIRAEGVPAVFGSEVFPSDVLDAIAGETGATYVGDLSDDVLPGYAGDPEHSYIGLMRRNAHKIVEALGGDPQPLETL